MNLPYLLKFINYSTSLFCLYLYQNRAKERRTINNKLYIKQILTNELFQGLGQTLPKWKGGLFKTGRGRELSKPRSRRPGSIPSRSMPHGPASPTAPYRRGIADKPINASPRSYAVHHSLGMR